MFHRKKKKIGDYQIKPKRLKRKRIIIAGSILIALVVIAITCYFLFFKEQPKKNTPKKKTPTPEVVQKPLTIVNENSNQRPIAVMLDNNIGNDLHAGLQESYINYEIIVEGGLTRIMAIFKDKEVNLIGPVRSSRHYFLDYALESDAIYTHFGWSPYAENDIKSMGINNINGLYDNAFWRDQTIAAPHNVYTTTEKLYTFASDQKSYQTTTTNWALLNYTTDPVNLNTKMVREVTNEETGKKEKIEEDPAGLLTANSVIIPYSYYQTRSYTYDATRGVYIRFMNNSPHIDKTTKEQLYYKNIIIEKVPNSTLDSYGRQDLTTTGSGTGYYITNGYALPIIWTKPSRNAKTEYTYEDGTKVKINDGNTFIQIEPSNYNPTIE